MTSVPDYGYVSANICHFHTLRTLVRALPAPDTCSRGERAPSTRNTGGHLVVETGNSDADAHQAVPCVTLFPLAGWALPSLGRTAD